MNFAQGELWQVLPGLGKLYFEHVFYSVKKSEPYEHRVPTLFLVRDVCDTLFLVSCCELAPLTSKWVVASTNRNSVIRLVRDEVSISDIFAHTDRLYEACEIYGVSKCQQVSTSPFIPAKTVHLELPELKNSEWYQSFKLGLLDIKAPEKIPDYRLR